jgi:hypothetical protein
MLIELDEAEAALASGFLQLLRGHLPNSEAMRGTAIEVARWLSSPPIGTDEEEREAREFLADFGVKL